MKSNHQRLRNSMIIALLIVAPYPAISQIKWIETTNIKQWAESHAKLTELSDNKIDP